MPVRIVDCEDCVCCLSVFGSSGLNDDTLHILFAARLRLRFVEDTSYDILPRDNAQQPVRECVPTLCRRCANTTPAFIDQTASTPRLRHFAFKWTTTPSLSPQSADKDVSATLTRSSRNFSVPDCQGKNKVAFVSLWQGERMWCDEKSAQIVCV